MRQIVKQQLDSLHDILQRMAKLRELDKVVQPFLPEQLRGFCKVANYRQGTLVFSVSNANWATELRFLENELLDQLRTQAGLYDLRSIKSVIITESFVKQIHPAHYPVTEQSADTINNSSESITFEPLRHALQHLAATIKKISKK